MKLLVAGDNGSNLSHLQTTLENWDYEVTTAGNEALILSALHQPAPAQIVLLDCPYASESELDIVRNIRATVKEHSPYLIMLTSSSSPDFLAHAIDSGVDDYASNSAGFPDLHARIRIAQRFTEMSNELHNNNARDDLTKLRNHGAILDVLGRELGRRDREHFGLSVVFLVIDQIGEINDTYGHLVGDTVLRDIAQRIHSALRPYDTLGRYGGAKLLMVLPHCTGAGALEVAERARMGVATHPIDSAAGEMLATVSIGIATTVGEKKMPLRNLVQLAKSAVDRARENGGNRIELAGVY